MGRQKEQLTSTAWLCNPCLITKSSLSNRYSIYIDIDIDIDIEIEIEIDIDIDIENQSINQSDRVSYMKRIKSINQSMDGWMDGWMDEAYSGILDKCTVRGLNDTCILQQLRFHRWWDNIGV